MRVFYILRKLSHSIGILLSKKKKRKIVNNEVYNDIKMSLECMTIVG